MHTSCRRRSAKGALVCYRTLPQARLRAECPCLPPAAPRQTPERARGKIQSYIGVNILELLELFQGSTGAVLYTENICVAHTLSEVKTSKSVSVEL